MNAYNYSEICAMAHNCESLAELKQVKNHLKILVGQGVVSVRGLTERNLNDLFSFRSRQILRDMINKKRQ